MARIHISNIIDRLSFQVRQSLKATVADYTDPRLIIDGCGALRRFKEEMERHCHDWAYVPDYCVRLEDTRPNASPQPPLDLVGLIDAGLKRMNTLKRHDREVNRPKRRQKKRLSAN